MFAPFPNISPNAIEWSKVSNVSRGVGSPLTGNSQTTKRPGDVWSCVFTWENLRDDYRHALMSWQGRLDGGAAHTYLSPVDMSRTGLPRNAQGIDAIAGVNWHDTAALGTNFPGVSVSGSDSYEGRVKSGNTVRTASMSLAQTLTNSVNFRVPDADECVVTAEYYGRARTPDRTNQTFSLHNAATSPYTDTAIATDGPQRRVLLMPKGLNDDCYLRLTVDSNISTIFFADSSFYRVGVTPGIKTLLIAAKNAQSVAITGFPAALRAKTLFTEGEYLELDGQLLLLTEDCHVYANGNAEIRFNSPLRREVQPGTPINISRPAAKMQLTESQQGHASRPYGEKNALSSFSMTFVEVID